MIVSDLPGMPGQGGGGGAGGFVAGGGGGGKGRRPAARERKGNEEIRKFLNFCKRKTSLSVDPCSYVYSVYIV